ncbi:MAG: chromate transporter [Bacteroidales bacterium]
MYWKIFTSFAKIGAFTIGGGYAMIPLIEREVVTKNHWIDSDEFLDMLAVAQSAPGLLAVNISIFAGYKIKGVKGSIIATIGSVLPSFIFILLVAAFFTNFRDNKIVASAFKGIRPVIVALIVVPMINMAIRSKLTWFTASIAIAALILISFLGVSPIWVLLATALGAVSITWYKGYKQSKKNIK